LVKETILAIISLPDELDKGNDDRKYRQGRVETSRAKVKSEAHDGAEEA
jgi:hypothetical protein